jgi:hypothetical protein
LRCGDHYLADPSKANEYCRSTECKLNQDRDLCCVEKKCPAGQGYVSATQTCETCNAEDPPEFNAANDQSPCGEHDGCPSRKEYFVYSNITKDQCLSCPPGKLTGKNEFAASCDENVPKGFGDDLRPSISKPKTRDGGESGAGGRCGCSAYCGNSFLSRDRSTSVCKWSGCEACEFCENEPEYDYCNEGRITITREENGEQVTRTYSKHDLPVKVSPEKPKTDGRCGCSPYCKTWLKRKPLKNDNLDFGAICLWTSCEGCAFCETDGVKYGKNVYCSDHHTAEINATQVEKIHGHCGCNAVKCPMHLRRSGMNYDSICGWTDCERCEFCEGRPTFDKCKIKYDTHEEIVESPVIAKTHGRCGCNANCMKILLGFTTASGHDYSTVCTWTSCEACKFCENKSDQYTYCHDSDGHARIVSETADLTIKEKVNGRCGCSNYCLNSLRSRNWNYGSVCKWTGCEGCKFCADGQHGNYQICN